MIDWNKPDKSANSLKGWLDIFEKSTEEIRTTERQIDVLSAQNTMFNRLFTGGYDVDLEFLKTRLLQYYDVKDVAKDKILEYDNE